MRLEDLLKVMEANQIEMLTSRAVQNPEGVYVYRDFIIDLKGFPAEKRLQSKKNTASTVVKASKENTPVNLEKKGVAKQAIHNLSMSSRSSPVASPVGSEKRGDRKQTIHNASTYSPSKIYSQIPKPTMNKIPTDDPKILSTKSGFALKHTFSAKNLFGKTIGK